MTLQTGIWRATDEGPGTPKRPTLFLDRDGVLVEDAHYLSDPDQVRLLPGAGEALAAVAAAGWRLVCVTNQSGIGRGYYTLDQFAAVQTRIDELLAGHGVALDALYYCPHDPDSGCACRKPGLGMIEAAGRSYAWPAGSPMVGDKASDLELAVAAGLAPHLVRTGYGDGLDPADLPPGTRIHDDLAAAVKAVLGGDAP